MWPLHQNFYSSSEDLDKKRNQRLQQPNQGQPHSPKYIGSSFIYTFKGWCKLPKDGVDVNLTCPIRGKLWPLHHNFYSSSEDLDKQQNQRLQQPNQDQQHSPKYIGSSFIHTSQAWCDLYMLLSQ
jgi:hypothetical protein